MVPHVKSQARTGWGEHQLYWGRVQGQDRITWVYLRPADPQNRRKSKAREDVRGHMRGIITYIRSHLLLIYYCEIEIDKLNNLPMVVWQSQDAKPSRFQTLCSPLL